MEAFFLSYFEHAPTVIVFIVGALSILTLSKGADVLVDHAVNLAKLFNIPNAVIGATIVSLGTTLPEASVSVASALEGNPDMALGNAIGSIICDTGMIIGIVALMKPIKIDYRSIKFQSWVQFFSGVLLFVLCLPFWHSDGQGNISQFMGVGLLILLVMYLYLSIKKAKETARLDVDSPDVVKENYKFIPEMILLLIGIAVVILSSKVLIPAVEVGAGRIGIPESIIAATLVAFGTSLPELTTAVKSVRKGVGDLAIGNIMGADILNVLFVVGASATATPQGLNVPTTFYRLQLPFMILILTIFRFFTLENRKQLYRLEGGLLFGLYIVYLFLSFV